MSNKALNWARKLSLKAGEKNVLRALADSYNDKKECCYPTEEKLAKWCGCHKRTIRRHLKTLISKNFIQKVGEFRNQLGHRVTTKYNLNFDLNLNSLPDNLSCGKLQSLPDNLSSLPDNLSKPTGQNDRKDYIINQNINQRETCSFSFVDNFEQQKQQRLEIFIGIKFDQLVKVCEDTYDLENARRSHRKICLENEQPKQCAENLLITRKQQKLDREKLIKSGEFVAAPCSLTNWLDGKRWLDIIKPLGQKKKTTPYVRCRCGEDYLRGSYCMTCAELKKPRVANG
jgi:hypothetical protein